MIFHRENRLRLFAATLVILLAAFFRLWNLRERGLYYFDEAMFLSNGRYFGGLLRTACGQIAHGGFDMAALLLKAKDLWDEGGSPWLHARPLHEGALIAASFLFGDSAWVGQGLSALAGIASVALLMGSAPGRMGIMAAALMALSLWHAHYSRCGLTQTLSVLPICATLFLIGKAGPVSTRRLIASGLLAGLAFSAHYNLFWFPPLLWLWLAAVEWKSKPSFQSWMRKMGLISLCMALPLAVIQSVTWTVKRILSGSTGGPDGPLGQFETYFQQLHSQIFFFDGAPRHTLSPLFLPKVIYTLENPAFAIFLLTGFFFLAWRSWKGPGAHRFWFWLALIPSVTWTVFGFPGPRSFLPALPALCLGAAGILDRGVTQMKANTHKAGFHATACVALLLVLQAPRLWTLTQAVSPWKIAAEKMSEHQTSHGGVIADTDLGGYQRGILRYHLGAKVDRNATRGHYLLWDATRMDSRWAPHPRLDSLRQISKPFEAFKSDIGQGMILLDAFEPGFTADYEAGKIPWEFAVYETTPGMISP